MTLKGPLLRSWVGMACRPTTEGLRPATAPHAAQAEGMKPSALPANLGDTFSVAQARDVGVSPARLRYRDLESPFRGMRVAVGASAHPAGEDIADLAESIRRTCRQYSLVMPQDQFFSHIAAAVLWDLTLPPGLVLRCFEGGIDVAVLAPGRTPRGARVIGHNVKASHVSVRMYRGLRLTSPASTWACLAGDVTDTHELVAVGDSVVREPMFGSRIGALATRNELAAAVSVGRRPGVIRLREALPLVRTRSLSRPESLLRLLLVSSGLSEPELNHPIRDHTGEVIAWGDLVYPRERVVVEFEGDHHRVDREQWSSDILRQERLERCGWLVVRVTGVQLLTQGTAVAGRVRRALRERS